MTLEPLLRWLTLRRIGIGLLVWLLSLWLASSAVAQDRILEKAWMEDPSGQMSWADAQARSDQLQTYHGVLSRGFGSSAIWIRLKIDSSRVAMPIRNPDQLVLRIRPVYLDEIRIHDPLSPTGLAGITGDLSHPREQTLEGLDFRVQIPRGEKPRDIWLRLTSTSTRQISIQLLDHDQLEKQDHAKELLYALYIGVIIVFVTSALVHWLLSREHLVGFFCLAQLTALGYAFCSLGYGRLFWPTNFSAHWLDFFTSFFSITAVSTAVFFHVWHIREYAPPAWTRWTNFVLISLLPTKLLLLLLGHPRLGLNINMFEIIVSPSIFLWSIIFAKGWDSPSKASLPALKKSYLIGFYALLWAILMVAALPGLALADGGEIPLYIVQAHGLVTALLILIMLQYRDRVLRKQQNEMLLSLERSHLQAEQEKNIREEQEKLITMLAHELKTPLSTMQMRLGAQAEGSREIRQAIRDMNGVIDRCVQTLRMSEQQLQFHVTRFNLTHMIQDLIAASPSPERFRLVAGGALVISSDHQLLSITLNNLLENAYKYAAPKSLIEIRIKVDSELRAGHLEIDIANLPGPSGWPNAAQVFDKYYRSPGARRQAGTGLGLFLVKNLLGVLGGEVLYLPDKEKIHFILLLPTSD